MSATTTSELSAVAEAAREVVNPTLSIDFEWRSGAEIKRGLPVYFLDAESAPLCMAHGFDPQTVDVWIEGQELPTYVREHVLRGGLVRGWNVMFEWYAWNWVMVPRYGWPELKVEQLVDSMAEAAAMNLPHALGNCGAALGIAEDQLKSGRGKELIKLLCIPQKTPKNAKAPRPRWINTPELLQELYDYCKQDVVAEMAIVRKLRRLHPFEHQVWIATQRINLRGVPIAVEEIRNILAVVEKETARLDREMLVVTKYEVTSGNKRQAVQDWCNERLPQTTEYETLFHGRDFIGFNTPDSEGTATAYADASKIKRAWLNAQQLAVHLPEDAGVDRDRALTEMKHAPQRLVPYFTDLQGETVDAALKDKALPADVRRCLEIRKAVSQSSIAKLDAMLAAVAADGTLKNMLVYHGASTGRYSSKSGVNLQNIKRPTIKDIALAHETLGSGDYELCAMLWGDDLMEAASALVRGVLKAPEGHEFVDADYSSVENRVSAWIAGQLDKVEMFRKGLDEYKIFASKYLFNVPYDQVTKEQRQVAKSAVLGCMFGQGHYGLIDYAASMGVTLTLKQAKLAVASYREEYDQVRALWYRCGDASLEAVRNPGVWVAAGEKLKLLCHKNFLWMRLPSGRLISWAAPKIENLETPWGELRDVVTVCQTNSVTKRWERDKLIGSSIFQSGVQGTARDIQVHGLMQAEEANYLTVLLIHDEDLTLNRVGAGTGDGLGQLICKNPEWALDLPLAFEAWVDVRFHK